MKEKKIDLEFLEQLTNPYPCPDCLKPLEAEKYYCERCKHILVFYARKSQFHPKH